MILYLTKINENISEDILENKMSLLCYHRLKKALECKQKKDRVRSVYAGLLLQYGVKEWLKKSNGILPTDTDGRVILEIENQADGKPYLPDYRDLFFSISHSGDYVGCVLAEDEVGLDIQQIRCCNHERMMKRFHENEITVYNNLIPDFKEKFFFDMWAAKEAYVKFTGKGMAEGFASFVVKQEEGCIYDNHTVRRATVAQIELPEPDYSCAIVYYVTKNPLKIIQIDVMQT